MGRYSRLGSLLWTGLAIGCAAGAASDSSDSEDGVGPNDGGGGAGSAAGGGVSDGGASNFGGNAGCGVPSEHVAAGVSDGQLARLAAQPSGSAPFVFDPPAGVVLPEGWPAPAFLVHTDELPELVAIDIEVGGASGRVVVLPTPAAPAHADSEVDGAWWRAEIPKSVWTAIRCGQGDVVAWRIASLAPGAGAPTLAAEGALTLLEGVVDPDMTYLELEQPSALSSPSAYAITRLAVASEVPQNLAEFDADHCVGCHTSSPDGKDLAYQVLAGGWRVEVVRPLENGGVEPSPSLSDAGSALLASTSLMVPATSAGAWSDTTGRWLGVVTEDAGFGLVQVDAEAPVLTSGFKDFAFDVGTPALSPDATRVVFVAADKTIDGYFGPAAWSHTADLMTASIALTNGAPAVIGEPAPLPYASETAGNETYPAFSADGAFLTFTRTQPGAGGYDEETAEIYVMRSDGSAPPVRIAGNDAPQADAVYAGLGLTNSWSRFGESIVEKPEGTYYFLLFSSRRGPGDLWENRALGSNYVAGRPISHVYLSTILVSPSGAVTTYPAALVPGQRIDAGAHTPTFGTITSVPPPPPQ